MDQGELDSSLLSRRLGNRLHKSGHVGSPIMALGALDAVRYDSPSFGGSYCDHLHIRGGATRSSLPFLVHLRDLHYDSC